jgi:hypothetical protein
MAGLVPAIHGLQIDPAQAVDASLRWHDEDMHPRVGFNGGWYKVEYSSSRTFMKESYPLSWI